MPDAQAVVTVRKNCGGTWIIIRDHNNTERAIRIDSFPWPNDTPFRIWAERVLDRDVEHVENVCRSCLGPMEGIEDDVMDERIEALGWQQQPESDDWRLFVPIGLATLWRDLNLEARQVARVMAQEAYQEWLFHASMQQ